MNEVVFRLIALTLYIGYMTVRAVNERKLKRGPRFASLSNASRDDKLELWVLGVGSLPIWVYMLSPWLDGAAMGLPEWVRLLGVPIALAGLSVFWSTHKTLAENWTPLVEAPPGKRLVTDGPYRVVRHPMYASFLLFNAGLWLVCSNWLAGGFAFGTFMWMYVHRVGREERMMLEFFGDEYRSYAENTGGVVPGIGRMREP